MRQYIISAQFIIGDDEDIIEVTDKWLRETAENYVSPSCQFDVKETIRIAAKNTNVKPRR
jgi:hypothetical protein